MGETVSVWLFFFWLTAGGPDGLRAFETREECVAALAEVPPQVISTSECIQAAPHKPQRRDKEA